MHDERTSAPFHHKLLHKMHTEGVVVVRGKPEHHISHYVNDTGLHRDLRAVHIPHLNLAIRGTGFIIRLTLFIRFALIAIWSNA